MLGRNVARYASGGHRNVRAISTSQILAFGARNSAILNRFKNEEIEAPSKLAQESSLPVIEQDLKTKPRHPSKKIPFLSDHKIENDPNYQMSGWKQSIGQWVIKTFSIDMDKSRAGPVAGSIYFGECKRQGLYYPNEPLSDTASFFYETLNLPKSFSQQYQIALLHYWILSVRMRAMPFKYGKNYQQKLIDRMFKDMELRMSQELKISSNRIIENYLKDYHTQLIGAVLSYDEGLMTDDITLASALWRNVFNGNPNVDMRHVEALLGYVRSQLYVLNKMSDREFGFGKFKFVPPDQVVQPLTKAQEADLKEKAKAEFAQHTLPSQTSSLSLDE
ncbi:Protein required for assembly of ubiquinol cytochrome-c reductase complex (cytochrome bc1 complex) [Scheffersomyces stipitis CBS 6054]|uniref:Protein required for assembly of ubiquinol cytochrome-c reductase complex (Cytochrome bc1 complex) n=1 Tax=Scheffersomyces stipitis (strain ATCC 58785 / CBS 6054 / NBRC 10063 / NRRL Y-11545) TaxID=322104 RepID=A3LT84_PICST|nr:Protein required for assembly of ubiquinol cytochrome-c reductase complex (cytochrome bc1 complex) [Scheffersomyces stipitis CBS 6054]ABN66028.2 Protein required for assembly of ubiquinol cytochrome-c reductase complex (cytochrome bc1 complex) [Scheffersomyces stipitis CBS 6054]